MLTTSGDPTTDGMAAPEAGVPPHPRIAGAVEILPGPIAGALVAGALTGTSGSIAESSALTFIALVLATAVARRTRWSALLPLMGALARGAGALLGALILALVEIATTLPGLGALGLAAVGVAALAATVASELIARRHLREPRRVRVAVIGSSTAADSLARELAGADSTRSRVAGRIRPRADDPDRGGEDVLTLGALDDLGAIVAEHGIDLLLMTAEVPRLAVFDEISRSCLHLPVRLQELAGFYEDEFGHVPVAEINAAWFQYIMHPRYQQASPLAQRALDLVISALALIPLVPLMGVIALLVRRDGGPALFKQERIGEGGRAFTIYKIRTMRTGASNAWAGADDDRITPIGRLLRRTHLDELPQLINVLRGEMSLVGPRPEQPGFVERLESTVPFYSRRHLIKPGLTGWAQVRCGYAGSDIGSAWKVSHDLFYLKHRSVYFDFLILLENFHVSLRSGVQFDVRAPQQQFILGHAATETQGS